MGNSESSLSDCRYEFIDPRIDNFNLSKVEVYIIDDEQSSGAAEKFLNDDRFKILYVDCEGHCFGSAEQRLGTVQVATGQYCCLIFHITKYRESLDFLKRLFESDQVRKVFHDCSGDSAVLFHENQIRLTNKSVDDTQVAHKVIESARWRRPVDNNSGLNLADLYFLYCKKELPGNKQCSKNSNEFYGRNMWIYNSELSEGMIKYAVMDVLAVCEIFTGQKKSLKRSREYKALIERQLERKIDSCGLEHSEGEETCPCIIM